MEQFICIKTYPDRLSAELAKTFLEARGVKSIVSGDDYGGSNPWLLAATGGARLLVKSSDVQKARYQFERRDQKEK